jgi:hypothetical protein
MSWVRNKAEELRSRVEEVEDLGDEEQEQSFAEMPEDPNHCKYHSREVAISIANEHLRRIPVMP